MVYGLRVWGSWNEVVWYQTKEMKKGQGLGLQV